MNPAKARNRTARSGVERRITRVSTEGQVQANCDLNGNVINFFLIKIYSHSPW